MRAATTFPAGTALREAGEEVGLDPAAAGVPVARDAGRVDVRVSGFLMVPVLAVAEREPEPRAGPARGGRPAARAGRHFLPDAPIEIVEEERDGWRLRYGAYPVRAIASGARPDGCMGQLGAVLGG